MGISARSSDHGQPAISPPPDLNAAYRFFIYAMALVFRCESPNSFPPTSFPILQRPGFLHAGGRDCPENPFGCVVRRTFPHSSLWSIVLMRCLTGAPKLVVRGEV